MPALSSSSSTTSLSQEGGVGITPSGLRAASRADLLAHARSVVVDQFDQQVIAGLAGLDGRAQLDALQVVRAAPAA